MPPSARIPVDPIEGLHVFRFLVTRLAFLIVALGVGARRAGERRGSRGRCARAERAKKLATAHCFAFSFHRRHLLWSCWRCLPLFGQREGIRLYFDKHLAEHSYSPIKIGGLGAFEIGEEALDPRLEVLLEQLAISPCRRREPAADKSGHDLAEDRSVI